MWSDKNIFQVEDSLVLRAIIFTSFNRIERFKSLFQHPNYATEGCIKHFDFLHSKIGFGI